MTAINTLVLPLPSPKSYLAGQHGIIERFTNDYYAGKLMAMGILPGTSLHIVRRAPLGGGWYVRIGRQNLALRNEELASIVMNP